MALTSLSCLHPEGNVWGKALTQFVKGGGKLVLRRTKLKYLKVAGKFFALKREGFAGERKTIAIHKGVLYLGNPFFSGHGLLQEYARSLQVEDSMFICLFCLFIWQPFYLPYIFYSLLLYLLQLLSPCATQLHTSQLVEIPLSCASFRVHLTSLCMPFCVYVCPSPAFHIAMVKETQLGFKRGKSAFR